MDPVVLLSIGEFARAARLSVKALRHYDATGVLVPAHVDAHSGYRRYDPAQLHDALLITLLRQADIGLPVVRSAIRDRSQLPTLVEAELDRLRGQVERAQQALDLANRLVDGVVGYVPTRKSLPTEAVDRRTGTATAETLDSVVPAVIAQLDVGGAPVTGRYPVQLEGTFEFDVNVPDVDGRHELPGGDFVAVVHRGPYALLPLAYHALFGELSRLGAPVTGPVLERYLSDSPDDLRTEVLLRVQ